MGWKSSSSSLMCFIVLLTIFAFFLESVNGEGGKHEAAKVGYEKDDRKEFVEFCENQEQLRQDPDSIKRDCKRIHEKDFHDDDLHMLFMLFMIVMWGAIVRTMLRVWKVNLPYTVVLMISGIILGIAARYKCFKLYPYSALARIKPETILFGFLPVLIFETAFGISSHVFLRACSQILVAAFPGMIIATALTAMLCYQFFTEYKWTFLQSCFYGSIISATDPVAVVAILKEVGVAESLAVLIDGESLLNDGVAILLFEIFKDLIEEEEEMTALQLTGKIILMFLRIAVGGPVFGYIAAKISIFCLSKIFNDAIVEITISLVAAYLTYYLAEDVLGVSGVCAVVLLGITMSSEKASISPDIIEEVHEFWEMLAHLANTILFFITGLVISERGSRDLTAVDIYYLILLYFALNFIRFIMLLILMPFLSRWGYGLSWQNLIVMMWGGLRGGVGICLSLQVYEDTFFCEDTRFGPKVLFQTAGIVLLTLLVNGTTTKKLLQLLGLTAISSLQVEEMQIAVQHVMDMRLKGVSRLKHDRYLSDANWGYIYKFTAITNPYKDALVRSQKPRPKSSILYVHEEATHHPCPACLAPVANEPSNEEYRVMTEEARLRILKALKIQFNRQFEQGILTEEALKILSATAETFTDTELAMIHTTDIKKYWKIRGIVPWIRAKMIGQFGPTGRNTDPPPPKPELRIRVPFWWVVTRPWFETVMTVIILINMVPALWEFFLDLKYPSCLDNKELHFAFYILNWIFTLIYFFEFLFKVVGLGCKRYWTNKWNCLDFFILVISILDIVLASMGCEPAKEKSHGAAILKGLRLFRVIRSVKLVKPLIPAIITFLNGRINRQMFFGFDVAVGYLTAIESVLKYINQLSENTNVTKKIRIALDKQRTEILKEIGMFARDYPGIALAVKTRHASRKVLNQMRNALDDLRMDGLLDEKENQLLTIKLEERMKRLWSSPNYIAPSSPDVLVQNLSWVYGNSELRDFVFGSAEMVTFHAGDVIASTGDEPNGLYVIITGMVKITYEPIGEFIKDREMYGSIPNVEIFRDFEFDKVAEDYFSSGTVIGEAGFLTKRPRSGNVICESDELTAYFISTSIMDEAMNKFGESYDSLESRLWRSCGIRRGTAFLPTTTFYKSWSPEKIQMHIERSCVPIGPQFDLIEIPDYVLDIFVIEGYVQDYVTGTMFVAPCLVSRSTSKLVCNIENPKTMNRILMITQDNIGSASEDDELALCVTASRSCRRGLVQKKENEDDKPKGIFHLNFNMRLKKRRKATYVEDDNKKTKDGTIRRRVAVEPTRGGNATGDGMGSNSTGAVPTASTNLPNPDLPDGNDD